MAGPSSRCVLIVEDDADIREAIREILEDEGLETMTASNGAEALARLRATPVKPALVLLDLMMPVMDGYDFYQTKQRDPELAGIPTVVVSAAAPSDERAAALQGAERMPKPIQFDLLLATVAHYCGDGRDG